MKLNSKNHPVVLILSIILTMTIALLCPSCLCFDGNSYADLVIGVNGEKYNDVNNVGIVHALYSTESGLSDANTRFFAQGKDGLYGQGEPYEYFGWALACGDFNGDGFADLAVGVHSENISSPKVIACAGAVQIIFGTGSGLTTNTPNDQYFTQDSPGMPGAAEPYDRFGSSLAAGDFDGDGIDDLAIGVPEEELDGARFAGAVYVLYGSSLGLTTDRAQFWTQDTGTIEEQMEEVDFFGEALAAGDVNGDSFCDLAIGAPEESFGEIKSAGCVHIIYGSTGGLTDAENQCFWQGKDSAILDLPESYDRFGRYVVLSDLNGDGFADLSVSAPYETALFGSEEISQAGIVHVLYGTASGITSVGNTAILPIHSSEQSAEEVQFGMALASGDIDGDGFQDLVIGATTTFLPATTIRCGAFYVVPGSAQGILAAEKTAYFQGDGIVPDESEDLDLMGGVLACGDFDGDGYCDVAAGVIKEDIELPAFIENAGAVFIVRGSASGLTGTGSQVWNQDTGNVGGVAEEEDYFGSALAVSLQPRGQSPCLETGVSILMPDILFNPNDTCGCKATVCNAGSSPVSGYPLFVILEIAGSYYFAPSFSSFDNYLVTYPQFPSGATTVTVLPDFTWPSGTGSFSGAVFYGAMTNPEMTALFGTMDMFTFSWSE